MPLVATLLTHPAKRVLASALVDIAARRLKASKPNWLADGIACDLLLPSGIERLEAEEILRDAISTEPVDLAVQDAEGRRKKLLLADMDSTIIEQECIDELADEVGLKAVVADITERSMRGEIAFEPALRERVALLRGLSTAVFSRILDNRITLASGARTLVATMKRHGAWTALVSGGFESFTGPIAEMIGFHEHRANRLIVEEGMLTGNVAPPILGRAAKADTLLTISERLGITPDNAIVVGDGANDLDMIRMAGTGVALHAKPAVAAAARFRVRYGDLTALLFLQGYKSQDFAA